MAYILKFSDEGAVIDALVDYLISDIRRMLGSQACYRWALAGGSTPGRLYRRLAQPDASGLLDWRRMRLFWSDERCVPPGDPQSNYRMVRESLLDQVPIPAGNIFPIDGTLDAERSAAAYAAVLGEEPLDCVLLGMGDDGHTASLFPDTPRLREESRAVIATRSPLPPVHRVSLSLRTINAARRVFFLVLGDHKAVRVARVMDQLGRKDADLPAAMVNPERGALHWFLDYAAAAQLDRESKAVSAENTIPPEKD
jgi:6-phosphogluconolactonase